MRACSRSSRRFARVNSKFAQMFAVMAALMTGMIISAPGGPPALREFAAAWSKVQRYTAVLVMHETAGKRVQDRTYQYTFAKPHTAGIFISDGPGKGGREAWTGGDTVIASPPGLFSRLRLHLAMTDSRVVTLRGDTIAMASFGWLLQHLQSRGQLSQSPGPVVRELATTQLSLTVADPAANGEVTRDVIDLSTATKLPVRVLRYVKSTLVKQIDFKDVKIQQ